MTATHTRPELSVVIPAYNEEDRLPDTLEKICAYLQGRGLPYEILVADDGSRDGTAEVAATFAERGVTVLPAPQNQGKGAAVRRGVLASRGQRVLISDADLSTPIEDLETLEPHLAETPVVFGSRAVKSAQVRLKQPFYREMMGKTFNKILWLAGIWGIHDTQCGFKLLDGDVARDLFQHLVTPGFAFDVEVVWLARRAGHDVAEVGVVWVNSPSSRVSPLWDPPRMLLEIVRFRWHHWRTRP